MVQLNLNFTHVCWYTSVPACLLHVNLKIWCALALMRTILACVQHTDDTGHELTICLPQYMCDVPVQ